MAKGTSNVDLKRRNGRIFRAIESKLESNDEETFLNAAGKIRSYVEKREAYYPEARPLIVNICKTARATLTRLANSNVPFSGDRPFPPELKNRALAYALLIGTVLRHASTFETDHLLKEDLRDLFNSVMLNAPQASELTAESSANTKLNGVREETQSHVDATRSESKNTPYADVVLGIPSDLEAPTCLSRPSTVYTETHQETHSNMNDTETLEMGDSFSKSETAPFTGQLANDIDSVDPSAHPSYSFVDAGQAVNLQAASSMGPSHLQPPTVPNLPHGTLKGVVDESAPSEKMARTRLARKVRKIPKLVGKAQTDITLEDMDWQYHMLKQQQMPDPRVSSGSVVATANEQNANISISFGVADPVSVVDGKVKETVKALPFSLVDDSREGQLRAGSSSASNDSDAVIDMNLDLPQEESKEGRALARDSHPTSEGDSMGIFSDRLSLAQPGIKQNANTLAADSQSAVIESADISTPVANAQASVRAGSIGAGLGRSDGDRRFVSPRLGLGDNNGSVEHVDATNTGDSTTVGPSIMGRFVESNDNQSSRLPHETLKDTNTHNLRNSVPSDPQNVLPGVLPNSMTFGAINVGGKTDDTVVMEWEMAPDQKDKLAIWQMRDRHEREVSGSICLSLACYKISDVLEAGFNFDSKNGQILSSFLLRLTPSWPTNARLSADIGTSRLFLAPPLQVTMEGLVDISLYISGGCVRIHLDQAEDMTEYIFALVAHPPTSSQLLELEERKAKNRKFRTTLESLRLTVAEVFG